MSNDSVWVTDIRDSFVSNAACVFLLHGVRDLYPLNGGYSTLPTFLHHTFCGGKSTVCYDLARGISFPTDEDCSSWTSFLDVYARRKGGCQVPSPEQSFRPEIAIPLLGEFLMSRDNAAVIIDYVDKIVPRDEMGMNFDARRIGTMIREWAQDPRLQRRNSFVFLLTETLSAVSEDLYGRGGGAHVVALPLADEAERLRYVNYSLGDPNHLCGYTPTPSILEVTPEVLAQQTNGLTCLQVGGLLRTAIRKGEKVSVATIGRSKRSAIEREIGDLVEFTEPKMGLDAVAGVELQKGILQNTAKALLQGDTEVVPKGILLLGPPGCGKTFTMQCFAHDCNIPFLQLKNVFSKYVGATESNLEKLFHFLDALAPVFVFIDEFDQSYGRRVEGDGDSGVSRRVFGMFNAFLSDESRQGKVLFGAATNRPDLIDQSTMRAGRFDLKLPFLLPTEKEREAILAVTLDTLNIPHGQLSLPQMAAKTEGYSGADLKEVVKVAQRRAIFAGRKEVADEDLQFALDDYLAPGAHRNREIKLMELLAVEACTSRSLLTPEYAEQLKDGSLHQEMEDLKLSLGR